jgi:subtilisin family serine protease
MNRQILIGAVVIFVLGGTLYAEQPEYKQGVVLVRFANDPNKTVKNSILNSVLGSSGSPVKSEYKLVQGLTLVSLPAGVSVENALASLKQSSSIMYAGPDYVSHAFAVPNDSRFSDLWGMRNTGQAGGTSGADIDAPGAWDISTGNGTIIVAVTDTGVDYTHSDLAANMWTDANGAHGYDFVNNDNDPMDDYGHGTHVAGTIGAVGNNGLGVAGVCWHTKIMALKVLDANGMGYLSDSISAVQYAVSNGARVINASWGYSLGVPFSYLQPLYDAIAAARDVNVIFVAAAGNNINNNNDASPAYPASFDLDNVISVMATTNTDVQAYYSNYGLMSVDLGAPGGDGYPYGPEDILSTIPGGGYDYKAGTSMASFWIPLTRPCRAFVYPAVG